MTATLTKKQAKALIAFASKDSARPALCGVLIEPIKAGPDRDPSVRFVATDGHAIARLEVPGEADDPLDGMIVPRSTLHEAVKGRGPMNLQIHYKDGPYIATRDDEGELIRTVDFKPIDRTFPAHGPLYDRARNDTRDQAKWLSFDPALWARVELARKAADPPTARARCNFASAGNPVIIEINDWEILLMPMAY